MDSKRRGFSLWIHFGKPEKVKDEEPGRAGWLLRDPNMMSSFGDLAKSCVRAADAVINRLKKGVNNG